MEETRNEELEQLLKKADSLDWRYTIYYEPEGTYNGWHYDERHYVELKKYSPTGEDFSMIIDFDIDNTLDSFLENLKAYSENFDIDEHVEMWIPERGNSGCPSGIRELVEDAENIQNMIIELYQCL